MSENKSLLLALQAVQDEATKPLLAEIECLQRELAEARRDFDARMQTALLVNEQRLDDLTETLEMLREARDCIPGNHKFTLKRIDAFLANKEGVR
jgi:hypothetical protein